MWVGVCAHVCICNLNETCAHMYVNGTCVGWCVRAYVPGVSSIYIYMCVCVCVCVCQAYMCVGCEGHMYARVFKIRRARSCARMRTHLLACLCCMPTSG